MGILPILDIVKFSSLPDECQDFAADVCCASSLVGHDALGSGHDCNTQATQDAGQLVSTSVDTQAGLGDAAQAGDDLFLAGVVVLQGNVNNALVAVIDQLEGLDVAFVQQDLSDCLFMLEAGMSTVSCLALFALRIRVSISAMGSVMCIGIYLL